MSARLDGEAPGLPAEAVDGHLRGCPDCRAWAEAAAAVTRVARVAPAEGVPDLSAAILATAPTIVLTRLQVWLASPWRVGLVGVALVQLAIAIPALLLGTDPAPPAPHLAHELSSVDLALAVGFLAAAARPARAWGMLPLVGAVVAALFVTAGVDVVDGRAAATGEVSHVLEVLGLLFLWRLARPQTARRAVKPVVGLA
jgi:predicted anti-sigma-YlaC factor YlaD